MEAETYMKKMRAYFDDGPRKICLKMMVMTMTMTLSFYVTVAASLFPMTLTFLSFRVADSLDWNGNVLYMPNHRCIEYVTYDTNRSVPHNPPHRCPKTRPLTVKIWYVRT